MAVGRLRRRIRVDDFEGRAVVVGGWPRHLEIAALHRPTDEDAKVISVEDSKGEAGRIALANVLNNVQVERRVVQRVLSLNRFERKDQPRKLVPVALISMVLGGLSMSPAKVFS